MRILLASEVYFPRISGAVVAVHNLASELVRKGHTVAIFTPSVGSQYRHEKHKEGYVVYRFPSLPNPLKEKTRFVLAQDQKIRKAFDEFNPDIVHMHSPMGSPSVVQKIANKKEIPVICTHHFALEYILDSLDLFGLMTPLTRRALVIYLNTVYKDCNLVTCPSESMRQVLIRSGIKADIRVVSNGISTANFLPVPAGTPRKLPDDVPNILFMGRMSKEKNLEVLFEAVPLVLSQKSVRFVLAGTGDRLPYYKSIIRRQGLSDWVVFIGNVQSGSALQNQLYHESTAFVITSNIETQGIVVMEAMACGLPVIASRSAALPELVRHGESGYLFTPDHSEDLATRILQIVSDPEKAKQMGQAGRELIKAHELSNAVDAYIELYHELLS